MVRGQKGGIFAWGLSLLGVRVSSGGKSPVLRMVFSCGGMGRLSGVL